MEPSACEHCRGNGAPSEEVVTKLEFNPAARELLCRICAQYPDTPFLALGQTVFWDEPSKAFFVQMLYECMPQAEFWHGVHNTDYFSRLPRPLFSGSPYALVEHNDGSTRGLWVAMCEASRLFGAEVVPGRAALRHYGCNLKKATAAQPATATLDQITTAWGWKGIISTGERELVARDVLLSDLREQLVALIRWAMEGTVDSLADSTAKDKATSLAEQLIAEMEQFARDNPDATLTALYKHMLARFYAMLLGEVPPNLQITASSALFRFNPETAGRPRFFPLGLFLHPDTRALVRRAYDEAVTGSGIYTLEHFGADALPFDLVVPGRGRGTICVSDRSISILTPEPVSLSCDEPVGDPAALARCLAQEFGDDIAIIGKAVMLIPMIAQEFLLVFHEGASGYTEHTHEFVESLEQAGISVNCHPILRLHHNTWDSLQHFKARFVLPAHLADAFGATEIKGEDFAARWRQVASEQSRLLERLSQIRKPSALAEFFADGLHHTAPERKRWQEALSRYKEAQAALARCGGKILALQEKESQLRHRAHALRQEIQSLEAKKGRHFREAVKPSRNGAGEDPAAETARREMQRQIADKKEELAGLLGEIEANRAQKRSCVREHEYARARKIVEQLEQEAETSRLRLVRNAILATGSLEQNDHRPTAWWLSFVSPEGRWYAELARTFNLEVESFCPKSEVGMRARDLLEFET